jgi:hypothetical protein
MFDGLALDSFALFDEGFALPEPSIRASHCPSPREKAGGYNFDESLDLAFQITRQAAIIGTTLTP